MKKRSFQSLIILTSSLFICLTLKISLAQEQQGVIMKSVLILYYDNQGDTSSWIKNFDSGLRSAFGDRIGRQFELNVEYTDLDRNPSKEYSDQLAALLEMKYVQSPPDVIIVNMNPRSEFLIGLFNDIFPRAKIIFSLRDTVFDNVVGNYHGKATSVYMDMRHDGSPAVIAKVLPDVKNVFVVTGNSIMEQNDLEKVRDAFEKNNKFKTTYLTGLPVDELLKRVGSLPENSAIYYTTYLGDSFQRPFLSVDVLSQIAARANAPIFSLFDYYMGEGILGGCLISSELMGKRSAELALKILDGADPSDISPSRAEGVNLFDWRQLQKWGINEKSLPEGSIIQYRAYSFFERYKWRIIFWVSLVILQFALIAYLWITLSRRRRAEEALSSSERKYRRLVQSTRDAIISMDRDGKIITCNMGGADMLGYPEDEIAGKHITILTPEEEMDRHSSNIRGVMEEDSSLTYESIMLKRDGTSIPVRIGVSAIKNESEEIIGAIEIIRDISEQRAAEEERKKLELALRQSHKMEAIGTLAGGIAHDFNNILTTIIGYSELTLLSVEKNSREEANLNQVLKAGRRARDLVNQILTFAKKTHEEIKPLLIGAIADEVLTLLRSTIPSSIEMKKKIETESLVMADKTKIHQIFLNICTNAVQAMGKDGGTLTVEIEDIISNKNNLLKQGDYVKITISDTGSGIPKQNLDLIFDPYFTTRRTGEGTGLGLSVVHGIVEGYDGKIVVDSEISLGTVFTIYLPATRLHPVMEECKYENSPGGTERIMFVDDEPSIVEMIGQLLESLGYTVTCKNGSIEALRAFSERPEDFDLIITDMTMPHMNGVRLGSELIKIRSDIPIILCTGYSKTIAEAAALRAGIKAFIMKPIGYRLLAKTIRDILDNSAVCRCGNNLETSYEK